MGFRIFLILLTEEFSIQYMGDEHVIKNSNFFQFNREERILIEVGVFLNIEGA